MNKTLWYILLLLSFGCSRNEDIAMVNETSFNTLSVEEKQMIFDTIDYVEAESGITLVYSPVLQTFTKERTDYWILNNIHFDTLHYNSLGSMQKYTKNTYLNYIVELVNENIIYDLNGFIRSDNHNKYLISGDWTYIAVSMQQNYCCLALAK